MNPAILLYLRTDIDQHPQIKQLGPVGIVDGQPAWLWVRHDDARSGYGRLDCANGFNTRSQFDGAA